MREDDTRHGNDPMVSGDGSTARSLTSDATEPNGFTAVNGDNYSSGSFRLDGSAKQYMQPYVGDGGNARRHGPVNSNFHTHGWRPDDRSNQEAYSYAQPRELSPPRKRKRSSISVNVDNAEENRGLTASADGGGSPKRRATSNLDSAIDLTSPVTNMQSVPTPLERRQHDPPPIGPYVR